MKNRELFLLVPVVSLMFPPLIILSACVTGAEEEGGWTDENIEALADCSEQGYEDGQNNPFDDDKFRQCEALGASIEPTLTGEKSTYYEAFINGCIDARNTQDICERFTDE